MNARSGSRREFLGTAAAFLASRGRSSGAGIQGYRPDLLPSQKEVWDWQVWMAKLGPKYTGNAAHAQFVDFLATELKAAGCDIAREHYTFPRWEARRWKLSIVPSTGKAFDAQVTSYFPYSGQTSAAGVTGDVFCENAFWKCVRKRFLFSPLGIFWERRRASQCGPPAARSKIPFGELAKRVGNGAGNSQCDRSVSNRVPSEAIADDVHGAIGGPARHASLTAGSARLILKSKWKLELQLRAFLKIRYRDRQERDGLLTRTLREHRAHQFLGDLGKDCRRRNRRVERY